MNISRKNIDKTSATLLPIEQLIRSGHIEHAQNAIQKVALYRNNRKERLQIAHWARRVGLDQITLKLLYKIVRKSNSATPEEYAEYAMALIRMGHFSESLEILALPIMKQFNKIELFRANAFIYQWDYSLARVHLENYLKLDLTDYERKIGEINLAACDTILNPSLIGHISRLEKLQKDCEKMGAMRIQANALELMAQTYIYLKDYKSSIKVLKKAQSIVKLDSTTDGAFIKKWLAFAELGHNPDSTIAIQKVIEVREKAKKQGLFEVVRDCDFHLGIWNRNRTILQKLYFGTPFPAYRKRILKESKIEIHTNTDYLWRLNNHKEPKHWLDLKNGQLESGKIALNPKLQSLKLLATLSTDFYRPIQISTVFHNLYPDFYFDPFTSPNRIDKSMSRLRKEINDVKLPLIIKNQSGYLLSTSSSFGLLTYADYKSIDIDFDKIKNTFLNKTFIITDAISVLNKSRRTVQIIFKKWIEENKLKVSGSGPKIKYCIKNQQSDS